MAKAVDDHMCGDAALPQVNWLKLGRSGQLDTSRLMVRHLQEAWPTLGQFSVAGSMKTARLARVVGLRRAAKNGILVLAVVFANARGMAISEISVEGNPKFGHPMFPVISSGSLPDRSLFPMNVAACQDAGSLAIDQDFRANLFAIIGLQQSSQPFLRPFPPH
jgi:hypothetical protein